MSVGCGRRSTRISSGLCYIRSGGPATACGRRNDRSLAMSVVEKSAAALARSWRPSWPMVGTVRRVGKTHAFRLAILYFAVFAASVLGVLLFVYWMSAD